MERASSRRGEDVDCLVGVAAAPLPKIESEVVVLRVLLVAGAKPVATVARTAIVSRKRFGMFMVDNAR